MTEQGDMPDKNDCKIVGPILAIAVRTSVRGPMKEVGAVDVHVDGGLDGDVEARPDRGITLLSAAQWADVVGELGTQLPWHTRRANLLVDAPILGQLIGRTIAIGPVKIEVKAETKPCGLMDELHPGLRAALTPECRGGVYGRITTPGRLAVGDSITLVDA